MANINTKKHLFVLVHTKKGLVQREIKATSSDYKLKEKWANHIEQAINRNKSLNKP